MTSIGELRRRTLETLSRPSYSLVDEELLILNNNANLFGMNPAVQQVADTFDFGRLWAYPSENSDLLRERIATELSVSSDEVIVGNGSDELLDIVSKTFINPGDMFCQASPTFRMYKFYAMVNMAAVEEKMLLDGFALPTEDILNERAKVVALCQPNNPTGNLLDRGGIERILTESEGIVLLDEAYCDFCDSNMLGEVLASEHGIDVRTFSKAYGIAGLRAGFAMARKEIVDELRRVRTPFGLNSLTETVAVAALDNRDWVDAKVREMKSERQYLADKMSALGFKVYPSECNFILCKSPVKSADLVSALIDKGIAIRDFGAYSLLEDHVRVTIGPREYMDMLLEAVAPLVNGEQS
jgi:histidinol-phosphate aminotransferase